MVRHRFTSVPNSCFSFAKRFVSCKPPSAAQPSLAAVTELRSFLFVYVCFRRGARILFGLFVSFLEQCLAGCIDTGRVVWDPADDLCPWVWPACLHFAGPSVCLSVLCNATLTQPTHARAFPPAAKMARFDVMQGCQHR